VAKLTDRAASWQGKTRREVLRSGSGTVAALLAVNQVFCTCLK